MTTTAPTATSTDLDNPAGLFVKWFTTTHNGQAPSPWLARFAAHVLTNPNPDHAQGWPGVYYPPFSQDRYGLMDLAVFQHAHQPGATPKRLVWVCPTDRSVAAAYAWAKQIEHAVYFHDHYPASRMITELLTATSDNKMGLALGVLPDYGPEDARWLLAPDMPAIIIGTTRQIGSRFLFHSDRVTPRMAPIHAGLLGNDCTYVFDGHRLDDPFIQTLTRIRALDRPRNGLPDRFATTVLPAHPDPGTSTSDHTITLRLIDTPTGYPDAAVAVATTLLTAAPLTRTMRIVTPNETATSQITHQLAAHYATNPDITLVPLTARTRPYDLHIRWQHTADTCHANRTAIQGVHTILIGTPTQLAGNHTSITVDMTVTPTLPLDQLAGFVQATGHTETTYGATGVLPTVTIINTPDLNSGAQGNATWASLTARYPDGYTRTSHPWLGLTPTDLLTSPTPLVPVVTNRVLDLFAQTTFAPAHDRPPLAPYLTGITPTSGQAEPTIRVVWRDFPYGYRPFGKSAREHARFFTAPVLPTEPLTLPRHEVIDWIGNRHPTPGQCLPNKTHPGYRVPGNSATVCRVVNNIPEWVPARKLADGDTIIVPTSWGGLAHGAWQPDHTGPVKDVSEASKVLHALAGYRRVSLRLHPDYGWIVATHTLTPNKHGRYTPPSHHTIRHLLTSAATKTQPGSPEHQLVTGSISVKQTSVGITDRGVPYPIATIVYIPHQSTPDWWTQMVNHLYDDEDTQTGHDTIALTLAQHHQDVAEQAARYANRLGFTPPIQAALTLAGDGHDLGKTDPRFQHWLYGGRPTHQRTHGILAKTLGPPRAGYKRTYPHGYRHELASAVIYDQARPDGYPTLVHDLASHLIATSHGYARPHMPTQTDPNPVTYTTPVADTPVTITSNHHADQPAAGYITQFWAMNQTYGRWGLAWLEAVLRLADHRQSARRTTTP